VQPKDQLAYLRGHPLAFAGAIGRMITDHGASIAHDIVAQVSYWHVPGLIAILAGGVLIAVVVADAGRLPGGAPMRILALALAAVTVLVSLFLAYVGWNAVRAPRIDGYQGRYLLVVLAIIGLVLMPDRPPATAEPDRAESGSARVLPTGNRVGSVALVLAGCSAALLLAIELGLALHSYG